MKTLTAHWLGRCEYVAMVALQEELVRQRRAGEIGDTLLLLEHDPVITVGRAGNGDGVLPRPADAARPTGPPLPEGRGTADGYGDGNGNGNGNGVLTGDCLQSLTPLPPLASQAPGEGNGYGHGVLPRPSGPPLPEGRGTADGYGAVPVVETSRGGQATYHGPGQLVAYPIVDLRQWRKDLHWYLRQLEAAGALALRHWGLIAGNVEGHTGVWIEDRKIASIGVAVRGWITYHGLALNVACDMSGFAGFNPCGLPSATMVSLAELGVRVEVFEAAEVFAQAFHAVFGYDTLNLLLSGNPGGLAASN